MKTQLERDFISWLAELSAGVEWKYERRLCDSDGEMSDEYLCADCAEKRAAEEAKKPDGYSEIDGWDEAFEHDHTPSCEMCGALLICSPTRDCIENDIAWLCETEEISPTSAAEIHNWLTGMGDYQREKDWPQIEQHAIRLMKAHQVAVPESGTVRFRPFDAIENVNGFHSDWPIYETIWFLVYQHFANLILERNKPSKLLGLKLLGSDSYRVFGPLTDKESACRHMADLFQHAGRDTERGQFLASVGINTFDDLKTSVVIRDERSECIGGIFQLAGRRLREPGPNQFHPKALTVYNGQLVFGCDHLWQYEVNYSYPHERSSWHIVLEQTKGQTFAEFVDSIEPWIESKMEPDKLGEHNRLYRQRCWRQTHDALEHLFYFDLGCEASIEMADALQAIGGPTLRAGRIDLTTDPSRLATIREWIKADAELARRENAAAKPRGSR